MSLKSIFQAASSVVGTAAVVSSAGRGLIRRETSLSPQRLAALRSGRNLEVTLERTLIALKTSGAGEVWFNQLNVAGGVGGGSGFNRAAVDLGRICRHQNLLRMQLNELKGWTANDGPAAAVEELFEYAAWLALLRARGQLPYSTGHWPKIVKIELQLIAPAEYFERHGGVLLAQSTLERAESELNELRAEHAALTHISFTPMPIVLPARIGAPQFVRCFDGSGIEERVSHRSTAPSALDVLQPGKADELRKWLDDALSDANLN